jgi:hypothetical protein
MKKSLLLKSGWAVAALLFSATPALSAAEFEGNLYEVLSSQHQERGAFGPIRSDEAVRTDTAMQYEGDMYEKFRLPAEALRGAMGPIRSDEPRQENTLWKELQQRAPVLGGGNG